MQTIPLESIPNQNLSFTIDGHRYELTLKEIDPEMCVVTVVRDGVTLVDSARAVPGYAILRYAYLQGQIGNFAFITVNGEYPHYSKFNSTQELIYATTSEIEAMNV